MRTADYALRPLTAADAPAMVALLRDAFAEHAARLDPPPSAARETAAAIAAALAEGGGAGCEIGGALAGGVLWVER
ncbi:MAG: hypothetical protein KGL55_13140, partial [Rhodospirillales bacterium]|nr:hypothetical protein [Rhodospirillales bacterium]